ncbi:hypothetical protein [Desulfonema magnum]|uniref:hypothetical protein n=1 Tax=Desulfonema magnum TaxID=45655 RepID=UPI001A9AFB53|nr:hypothetical protein [Desulfonema magnum]
MAASPVSKHAKLSRSKKGSGETRLFPAAEDALSGEKAGFLPGHKRASLAASPVSKHAKLSRSKKGSGKTRLFPAAEDALSG